MQSRIEPTNVDGMTDIDPFLTEVTGFLNETQIAPSALGLRALNDKSFVPDLMDGRECRRETRKRVRDAMSDIREEIAAAAERRGAA